MPNEGMPVNRSIIEWARRRAGYTLEQLEPKFRKFAAWEAGEEQPSYTQLEQLAAKFHIPVVVFFFPNPPRLPPIRESFRTIPDTEFELMPPQVRQMLHKAKALQINLAELTGGQNPSERFILRDLQFSADISVERLTSLVRDYLDVSLVQQYSWADPDTALKEWRKVLHSVGVFVFKDAFHSEKYCGFSLFDTHLPIIYVNNSTAKTRQIFTLFHELAHLLFHTSGIDPARESDVRYTDRTQAFIEVLCNKFAGQFLVPDEQFLQALGQFERSQLTAERIAKMFNVSREVIYRKFLDRQWITQSQYSEAVAEWNSQRATGGSSGGNHYNTKLAYLGREYVGMVLGQYHKNKITESQLAGYLDTKPRNLATLEEYFLSGAQ